ncbi:DUF887-domain-containing protein [Thelephora terrestris]|uniref:DUF887-domain-containing protein n=1 Tax=Thelephora terrestris TaxID=56493 RepID=A0A9P6HPX6_9AGAM|nr:DUF887-domain-containing protein [Thelephora terrestris]
MAHLLDKFTSAFEACDYLFREISRPVAGVFGLENLGPHFDVMVYSFVLFNLARTVFVPGLSRLFFNRIYGDLDRKTRNKWNCRGVSLIHVAFVIPLAIRCLDSPALSADRAFGWDERAGTLFAIAAGYFLWDTIDTITHFEAFGFVAHGSCHFADNRSVARIYQRRSAGTACFFVYFLCFRPFLAYYAVRCLLWEGSTIFLNLHWYMDKSGFSGSRIQLINGCFLLLSFIALRIIYGGFISFEFFRTVLQVRNEVPLAVSLYYACGNAVLQSLNWIWMIAILKGFKKRMSGSEAKSEPQVSHRKLE